MGQIFNPLDGLSPNKAQHTYTRPNIEKPKVGVWADFHVSPCLQGHVSLAKKYISRETSSTDTQSANVQQGKSHTSMKELLGTHDGETKKGNGNNTYFSPSLLISDLRLI